MTLYNVSDDVAESENLYFEKPEIVEELLDLLNKYLNEGYSRTIGSKENSL